MPGGNAPRFQAAMSLRLFGKNEKDTKVSADMPVLKSVSFVLRKWKVPILATNGTYDQIMVPHKGLKVGEVDDWGTLSEYLKQLGLLAKNPKSGWDILGKTYPTLQAFRDLIYADKKMGADIRKGVIDKMLQTGHMIGNTPDKQA